MKSSVPTAAPTRQKHSERMILCKLRRMPLGTGQRNLTKALKQLEGFLEVPERRQTFIFEKTKTHFFRQIDYFGEQLPPFYLLDAFLAGMIKVVAQPNNFWSSECVLSII